MVGLVHSSNTGYSHDGRVLLWILDAEAVRLERDPRTRRGISLQRKQSNAQQRMLNTARVSPHTVLE